MIGICFSSRRTQEEITKEREARMEDAAKEAKEQAKQDGEEWNEVDNDEGDGGQPAKLIGQHPALNPRIGGSKVNRAEQVAREKLEAKKLKKLEEAAKSTSGDVDTWDTKVEGSGWANQGVAVSFHEPLKPSHETPAPVERASIDSDFGLDGTLKTGGKETSHAGPIQAAETSNPVESSTIDGVNDESVPISTRLLGRLALLEAMDEEDGGVRL